MVSEKEKQEGRWLGGNLGKQGLQTIVAESAKALITLIGKRVLCPSQECP